MNKRIRGAKIFIIVLFLFQLLLVSTSWTKERAVFLTEGPDTRFETGKKAPAPGTVYCFGEKSTNKGLYTMAPGEYTVTDGNGTPIRLVVIPQFWNTWWFKGSSVLLMLGFLFLFYQKGMKFAALKEERKVTIDELCKKFKLSKREMEIVQLLLLGESQTAIEDKLFISYHTVKNHVYNIYKKLGIKNRFQLFSLFQGVQ